MALNNVSRRLNLQEHLTVEVVSIPLREDIRGIIIFTHIVHPSI